MLGTVLLKLPIATTEPITWIQSLFTATSAITVTGLVVVDTARRLRLWASGYCFPDSMWWPRFNDVCHRDLAGSGRKNWLLERAVAREAFNQTDSSTLIATAKSVLMFALLVELIGFTILSVYWSEELGWKTSLFHGFFYTISAFNNAGFALSADSLMPYVDDPVVNFTITSLFIIGGLGFSVWIDLKRNRRWHRLTVYSRMMILGTVIINVVALIAIYLIEYDNPNTLAPLSEAGNGGHRGFKR